MAKRFRFRLESVLRLRKVQADEQRRVVAEILQEVRRSRAELGELHRRVQQSVASAQVIRRMRSLDVSVALQEQRWRLHLHRRAERKWTEIGELETRLTEARRELAARSMRVKALEKLRERKRQTHVIAESRREQFELDEAGLTSVRRVHADGPSMLEA